MITTLKLVTVPGTACSKKAWDMYKESTQQMNRSLLMQTRSAARASRKLTARR